MKIARKWARKKLAQFRRALPQAEALAARKEQNRLRRYAARRVV